MRLSLPQASHVSNDPNTHKILSVRWSVLHVSCRPTVLTRPQIMAAVRCKRSKWWFLVRTFFGKDWQEQELFYPPTDVRAGPLAAAPEMAHIVSCFSEATNTSSAALKPHAPRTDPCTPPLTACCTCG